MRRTLFLLFVSAAFGRSLSAQTLTVAVRDSAGAPIERVGLVIMDTSGRHVASTQSGADGMARWPKADIGTFRVFARRFGWKPQYSEVFHVGAGDTVALRITMERSIVLLDPIVILSQKDSVRRQWNPFGINLRATGGYIITPAEIEYSIVGARDMADVLMRRALPGIIIDQHARCPRSVRGGGCLPFVIDGQVYPNGQAFHDVAVPEMVDYVIVLRGSEVGVRYGSIGHNGIVLIATKRADWWRRKSS